MKSKLLVIGNGMVGIRTLEEILALAPDSYDITVLGKEKYPNYNRIQLSYILQQKSQIDDIITHPFSWYAEKGIHLYTDDPVVSIDTQLKKVTTAQQKVFDYDKLILATGSNPFVLPIPGNQLVGNFTFRDIDDVKGIMDYAHKSKSAIVIGGGLLGLEAASGLLSLGVDVTVVHLMDWLMESQLDAQAGELLKQDLASQGIHFLLGKKTVEILGDDHVTGIKFADGSQLPTDMVVMSIGIKPALEAIKTSSLEVNRGIVVNEFLQTSDPDVYAVGECAETHGIVYGLVAPLFEQSKILAAHLTQQKNVKQYNGSNVFASLKISGCDLFSAGNILKLQDCPSIRAFDSEKRNYKRIFIKDNHIQGIILYGDTTDGTRLYDMLCKKVDVSNLEHIALLGDPSGKKSVSIVDMPDDTNVCSCNGVSKGEILYAIREHGLTSVAEVGTYTRAGTSCGKCKPTIKELLEAELGGAVKQPGMCECTPLSRDEVVDAIQKQHLLSTTEVYKALNFKNPEGCAKCRPAINYYLNMSFPHEHVDEQDSRIVHEKLHANIQIDGKFSIVPRMRAGLTNSKQLIAIANVAEEYGLPIKVTSSLRIGMVGAKREDLPAIWKKLGMESSEANAKGFRSVRTCVGKEFCRFGKQNSLSLGVDIEKAYEYIDSPHKFKVGVSGCPQNCSECVTKDFGVIGTEKGFQIYIGGNGGTTTTIGQFLCEVTTPEEVVEMCGAVFQYYRKTAIYAERTAPWVKRLGFEKIKEIVMNPENRKTLLAELRDATDAKKRDPWTHIVDNDALQEKFQPVDIKEA